MFYFSPLQSAIQHLSISPSYFQLVINTNRTNINILIFTISLVILFRQLANNFEFTSQEFIPNYCSHPKKPQFFIAYLPISIISSIHSIIYTQKQQSIQYYIFKLQLYITTPSSTPPSPLIQQQYYYMIQTLKQQTYQLSQGIYLRKRLTQTKAQQIYIFELQVLDFNNIQFEIDFTGSQNIKIKTHNKCNKIIKIIQPYRLQFTQIAKIYLNQSWKLKTKWNFNKIPISIEKQLNYIKSDLGTIQAEKTITTIIFQNLQIINTSLDKINSYLAQSMVKFVDPQFPPLDSSIYGDNLNHNNIIYQTVNHWRRPQNFLSTKQYYLFNRLNYKNLTLGKLNDYPFFSTITSLIIIHPYLIDKLFYYQKQINPNGIYKLCFCKNGHWQSTIIDDYIPCQTFSKPKFIYTLLNQIWIYLLQKSYAKIYNRYLALPQLQINTVFHDLTGCPTFIINLQEQNAMNNIVNYFNSKYIVTFYTIQQKVLVHNQFTPLPNYAYLLTHIQSSTQQLFHIVTHHKTKQQLPFQLLLTKFQSACICCIQNWQQLRHRGKFITLDLSTPQTKHSLVISQHHYVLQITQPSQLYICLYQQDLQIGNNKQYKKYYNISLVIFQMFNNTKYQLIQLKKYTKSKQHQIKLSLNIGFYYLIPIVNQQIQYRQPPTQQDYILDIFKKLDLSMSNKLKYKQLEQYFKVLGQSFTQSDYNILLNTYVKDNSSFGYLHFKRMWYSNKKSWRQLAISHYNKQLIYTISIHSTHQLQLKLKPTLRSDLPNLAHCQLISRYGKQLYLNQQNYKFVTFMYLQSNNKIVEYMIESRCDRKILVTVDFTECINYQYNPNPCQYSFELNPQQKKYIMKLIPKQNCENNLQRKQNIFIKYS